MSDVLDVVVIGAGWAGLGVSHGLKRSGISHVVLERARIGETWRTQRWDSFHFNIPRVLTVLPGDRYEGSDPEGAMTRDEFVTMLEGYVSRNSLPVHTGEPVAEVAPDGADGYRVRTPSRTLTARNVVVASGSLNRPRRPADQQPAHVDGIAAAAGIYFAGLDFASTRKSGTILSSADESRTIVGHILGRLSQS